MSKWIAVWGITLLIGISSCSKDDPTPKPPIANLAFQLYDFRTPVDTIAIELPNGLNSTLMLKSDYTWTLDLDGAKSSGKYTWTPTANQQADMQLSITQWTDLPSNSILSNKLKSALLAVTSCGYSLTDPSYANFLDLKNQKPYFPFVRTNKK
ncbi:hypothetical protein [Sediminibacterium sp. TEGAF015]|uniref:hypothetical protein n=1 Tax=Sediminibacterium sp. TEGAF015 TaxID=575378 RepID=UPI0022086B87|nr:hypothetical protein [Sediminibacterium sp. TEGAF015]BDQ12150.1 hypothetical protein TEGAF0_13670 [Sediminibacterium sp. TEGAF015]